jgi:hypothetical protein
LLLKSFSFNYLFFLCLKLRREAYPCLQPDNLLRQIMSSVKVEERDISTFKAVELKELDLSKPENKDNDIDQDAKPIYLKIKCENTTTVIPLFWGWRDQLFCVSLIVVPITGAALFGKKSMLSLLWK